MQKNFLSDTVRRKVVTGVLPAEVRTERGRARPSPIGGFWSADGAQVLTISEDATARVWKATDGQLLFTLRGHDGPLWDARWSGDERLILTRSSDHSARVWDAKSGDPIVCIGGIDDPVEQAEWHPRTHRMLVHTAMGAWIWDIDLGVEPRLTKVRGRVSRRLTGDERRSYGLPAVR